MKCKRGHPYENEDSVENILFTRYTVQRAKTPSHQTTLVTARGLAWILRFLNFCDHVFESVGNIFVESCACLGEAAFEFFGQFPAVFG